MKKRCLFMIPLVFLLGCAGNPATADTAIAEKVPGKPSINNDKSQISPRGTQPKLRSIQINGKKYLRYEDAAPWRLFDTELSQYAIATNTLVLSSDDLSVALANASLQRTFNQWQQIALNTYQASFDMQLIEQHYRRLQKAGLQVEWLLDYSVKRQADEM